MSLAGQNVFFAEHFALDMFGHFSWGVNESTMVTSKNEAPTRLIQAKQIPLKQRNFCDRTLQFIFSWAHVPGTENLPAKYWSRLYIELQLWIQLKLTDNIPVYHIRIPSPPKRPNETMTEPIMSLNRT